MKNQTHYECLGVPQTATTDDIKRAFRAQAKEHHPDHNPGDATATERFRKVTDAYEVLSDQQRRAAYDKELEEQVWQDLRAFLNQPGEKQASRPTPVTHTNEPEWRGAPTAAPPIVPVRAAAPPIQVRPASRANVGEVIAFGAVAMAVGAILGAAFGGSSGQPRGPDGRYI